MQAWTHASGKRATAMTGPQISVVVPFHNNEDLLGECLGSIAAQTVTSLEVIMVDDGSTDGGVERIGPAGITPSSMHSNAIKTRRIGTHISRSPELFWDVSVWNKLFRRSFWDSNGMTFPEVMAWEDLQAMTRAHVLATAVDVIPDPIYYWRERGKGALSITQSRTSIRNFRH